jgi:hypothetical protein
VGWEAVVAELEARKGDDDFTGNRDIMKPEILGREDKLGDKKQRRLVIGLTISDSTISKCALYYY